MEWLLPGKRGQLYSPGLGDGSGDEDGAYTVGQELEEKSKQSAGILPFWILSMFPVIKVKCGY